MRRLADDYFFIACDNQPGRARLSAAVLGLGLAGSLVGELVLARRLTIRGASLRLVSDPGDHLDDLAPVRVPSRMRGAGAGRPWVSGSPPGSIDTAGDPCACDVPASGVLPQVRGPGGALPSRSLTGEILRLVASRPQEHDLAVWLSFLAAEALEDVGERMVTDGLMTKVGRRRWRRTVVDYHPTDVTTAAFPAVRLAGLLTRGDPVSLSDAVLTGLVAATGLVGHVLWDSELHRPGRAAVEPLLAGLPTELGALVTHTQVAVAELMLTKRG